MKKKQTFPRDSRQYVADINLFPFAILSLGCAVVMFCTAVAVYEISSWVVDPAMSSNMYLKPAYQRLIAFRNTEHVYTGFRYLVMTSIAPILDVPMECSNEEGTECNVVTFVVNGTNANTMTIGVMQHPGFALIGYGIPVSVLCISAYLLSITLGCPRLIHVVLLGQVAFLCVLARSETNTGTHVIMSLFMYGAFFIFHFTVARRVAVWYRYKRLYSTCILFVTVMFSTMLILSACVSTKQSYARFELACMSCVVLLQVFVSHIMYTISSARIMSKLVQACNAGLESFQLGESPVGSPRVSQESTKVEQTECNSLSDNMPEAMSCSGNTDEKKLREKGGSPTLNDIKVEETRTGILHVRQGESIVQGQGFT